MRLDRVMDSQKLIFANALRGVAALLVAISHLLGTFWQNPAGTARYLHAPPIPPDVGMPWFAQAYVNGQGWIKGLFYGGHFETGQFGVGLFFLISGFVIPFAFERQPRLGFIAGRAFRIWPLYAAGLTISIVSIAGVSCFYGNCYFPSANAVLAHLLFMQDIFNIPLIDGIVWTLNIEVKILTFSVPSLDRGSVRLRLHRILAFCLLGAGASSLAAMQTDSALALGAASSCKFICFMFVGVVINFLHRGKIDALSAGFCVAILLLLFGFLTYLVPQSTTAGHFIGPGWLFLQSYAAAGVRCFLLDALRLGIDFQNSNPSGISPISATRST